MNATTKTHTSKPVTYTDVDEATMTATTKRVIVVGRSARSTGPRWIFTEQSGRVTARQIRGAFAKVQVLVDEHEISAEELVTRFPTVKF